jgi:hypothetical protein
MNTIELIKDAAFFGGHIPNERLDECRNFFDNVIEKQLTLTDVVKSSHCELYDFGRQDKTCKKKCDSCKWMEGQ